MSFASICSWLSMIFQGSNMPIFSPIKPNTALFAFSSGLSLPLYQIDCAYSDNGTEFKGTNDHAFVNACRQHGIGQKFTRVNRSQTKGDFCKGL